MGSSVANVGDLDGNGRTEVAVGAPCMHGALAWSSPNDSGQVLILQGYSPGPHELDEADAAWAESGESGFGATVAGAGDMGGDGIPDVLVGAPFWSEETDDGGAVFVIHGPAWGSHPFHYFAYTSYLGGQIGDLLGGCVAGAGDVNADGYADILMGAPGADAVYFQYGPVSGDHYVYETTLKFDSDGYALGHSAAGAGDVDGDGHDDVLVGGVDEGEDRARAYLFHGPLPDNPLGWEFSVGNADAILTGSSGGGNGDYGTAVAGAGDVNGDGFDDVLVGAMNVSDAYLFLGPSVVSGQLADADAVFEGVDSWNGNLLGFSFAGAGDVNGDGYDDIVLGAPETRNGIISAAGAAYLWLGGASSP